MKCCLTHIQRVLAISGLKTTVIDVIKNVTPGHNKKFFDYVEIKYTTKDITVNNARKTLKDLCLTQHLSIIKGHTLRDLTGKILATVKYTIEYAVTKYLIK